MDGIVGVMDPLWPVITPAIAAIENARLERIFERRFKPRRIAQRSEKSDQRAKMAAMNHDAISAGLWALSSFDPALAQLAELREHFLHTLKLDEEDQLRITLDRLILVYVEGQCQELLNSAEITTDQANLLVEDRIGDPSETALHILACTDDPLAMELNGYALWLGSLTANGTAPWKRFASVMADCYHEKHPLAA